MIDRGIIKWQPFDSCYSGSKILKDINNEKNREIFPTLSEDQLCILEEKITLDNLLTTFEIDFKALERELQTKGTISNRLYSMYAKELFISGTKQDFLNAQQWFEVRFQDETTSQEARIESACVLAKLYTLEKNFEAFLSLCLTELTTFSTISSEICYLLGQYYEEKEQWTNAITWYKKAALETECFVCITYGGEYALLQAIRLLKQQGNEEEAILYQNYLQ